MSFRGGSGIDFRVADGQVTTSAEESPRSPGRTWGTGVHYGPLYATHHLPAHSDIRDPSVAVLPRDDNAWYVQRKTDGEALSFRTGLRDFAGAIDYNVTTDHR